MSPSCRTSGQSVHPPRPTAKQNQALSPDRTSSPPATRRPWGTWPGVPSLREWSAAAVTPEAHVRRLLSCQVGVECALSATDGVPAMVPSWGRASDGITLAAPPLLDGVERTAVGQGGNQVRCLFGFSACVGPQSTVRESSAPEQENMKPSPDRRRPRVYVNGRFLAQELTGVQRFAGSVLSALSEFRDDLVVVVPQGCTLPAGVAAEVAGTSQGHLWEQVDLVRHLRGRGEPLLLNLTNTGPLRYRNQVVTHHDISYLRHPQSYSWKFRTSYRLAIPRLLNSARAIITVSSFSKREIAEQYGLPPDKITVVPNAVDDRFRARATSEAGTGSTFSPSHRQRPTRTLSDCWKPTLSWTRPPLCTSSERRRLASSGRHKPPPRMGSLGWAGSTTKPLSASISAPAPSFPRPSTKVSACPRLRPKPADVRLLRPRPQRCRKSSQAQQSSSIPALSPAWSAR